MLQVQTAGIECMYASNIIIAALDLHGRLLHALKQRTLERTSSRPETELMKVPGQPVNLAERVLHSFARWDSAWVLRDCATCAEGNAG